MGCKLFGCLGKQAENLGLQCEGPFIGSPEWTAKTGQILKGILQAGKLIFDIHFSFGVW